MVGSGGSGGSGRSGGSGGSGGAVGVAKLTPPDFGDSNAPNKPFE